MPLPSARGARIKAAKGKLTVTDGPFSELNGVIGCYAILEVKSKQEAVEICKDVMQIILTGLSTS